MSKSAPRVRHRCVECRYWFEPAATAKQHQKVCSPECRKSLVSVATPGPIWRSDRWELKIERECLKGYLYAS